jgi:hypothetical protein
LKSFELVRPGNKSVSNSDIRFFTPENSAQVGVSGGCDIQIASENQSTSSLGSEPSALGFFILHIEKSLSLSLTHACNVNNASILKGNTKLTLNGVEDNPVLARGWSSVHLRDRETSKSFVKRIAQLLHAAIGDGSIV